MTIAQPSPTQDALAPADFEHERVLITTGARSGLTICVAVHSTKLGQALGGARVWQYPSWTDALDDALRLSRAMTQKNAVAGIGRGGGKSVIRLPLGVTLTAEQQRNAMLDLGDAVESLRGAYMTAEDVGTSAELMSIVAERTSYVCGLPPEEGGVGEPADATASGVYAGILATLDELFDTRDVAGRHFVIAGLGQVGGRLAERLAAGGARLTVADVNPARKALADRLGATWADPATVHQTEADLFVPCGLGGVLTGTVISELRVRGVVGAANNQLATRDGADQLRQRGILWAPDFVVNGGGVIFLALASEPGAEAAAIESRVQAIGDTITAIYRESAAQDVSTLEAAELIANARLNG
ncbi:Glu/Leu/Phe/Val dehydrogenase family protein [Diaminobutyricimonas sp. TR449]|uniref:Glu/Leu/Phe/Val dehydrogenase family protein n=1 Tax=Diaminobutyricimonas sp. TR449 TaxID=2708076 RepID=UPI001420CC32|nr:Glu/Leu/Phe/Val dehydrogenase family protein [Diaminobutyricimonas sp. TR449]